MKPIVHTTLLTLALLAGGMTAWSADKPVTLKDAYREHFLVTQGSLVSDAGRKLADAYAGLFRAFLKHEKSVKLVTFWGVNDALSWRANGKPLWFDDSNQPKPAFEAVIAEAKRAASAR